MRQRAMIAMALACDPKLLIADEPTTALDVTVQAQIVDLVRELQAEYRLAVVWITHDLGVVAEIADRVAVMYAGRILETGGAGDIYASTPPSLHLGTAPLDTAPRPPRGLPAGRDPRIAPPGGRAPYGCPFHERCPIVAGGCRDRLPDLIEVGAAGHGQPASTTR